MYLRLLLLFRLLSLKRRKVQLAAFLFPTRFTAVSSESAKDARFPSKVAPERVHQIALFEKEHL